jgi:hypothetical protein
LQLTNFGRLDTSRVFLARDGRRAFFRAAADPLGTNPSKSCQLFSITTLGTHLRQLTRFQEAELATPGCGFLIGGTGRAVFDGSQDPTTHEVVFYSTCNPFGANPFGGQLFAMRLDGSKLRQLTAARGRRVESNGVAACRSNSTKSPR